MPLQTFRVAYVYLRFLAPRVWEVLCDKIRTFIHKLTYRTIEACENVVVIGGSFGGIELTRKLASSLPTGYRVVLIERNSHFHYPFNFPRYSVLQGREHLAFIPFAGIAKGAPSGIYHHLHGEVSEVTQDVVRLANGEEVSYKYLAIATGAAQKPPARLSARSRAEGMAELRDMQESIKSAQRIAVIGGGAVGVELATDIKSYYAGKTVALVHSRERLLPRFGGRLHEEVLAACEKLGIDMFLGERPQLPSPRENGIDEQDLDKGQTLLFSDGRALHYDLIIPCTGQSPNSGLLSNIDPGAISTSTGRILVQPTLQIASNEDKDSRVFAFGDVAETPGAQMARSAWFQAQVVHQNILKMIQGKEPAIIYTPNLEIESALKLTVGKFDWLMYVKPKDSDAIINLYHTGKEDLDVHGAWGYYGADVSLAGVDTHQ